MGGFKLERTEAGGAREREKQLVRERKLASLSQAIKEVRGKKKVRE